MQDTIRGKRITVAGAAGFIGQNLVERLSHEPAYIRAVYHDSVPPKRIDGVSYVQADLLTGEGCELACSDTDIFVMAAAKSSGAGVMSQNPLAHLTPNVVMNSMTLQSALNQGVQKYCFISSNTVYPPGNMPMKEADTNGNFFPSYQVVAEMKLFSERMCQLFQEKSNGAMEAVIVRPSNLYGPFDKFAPELSKVIPSLVRRVSLREDPLLVWGDGKDIKDFLFIDDFLEGLLAALCHTADFEIFNICSGKSVELTEVIDLLLEESGPTSGEIVFDTTKPSMIPVRRLDNTKAREVLDWEPNVSLREGLRQTIAWFKENIDAK